MALFWAGHLPILNAPTFLCVCLPVGFVVPSCLWVALCRRDWSLSQEPHGCSAPSGLAQEQEYQVPPGSHHCPVTISLQSLWPMSLLSSRPREMVQWHSTWLSALIGRFLDSLLFCPPFPPPPFLSPVFCFLRQPDASFLGSSLPTGLFLCSHILLS